MLGPRYYQSVTHLLPEPAHRKGHPLTFDQAVVEPGRARRRHLQVEVDVRAVGEHQGRPGIAGATEPTDLDDATGRWRMREGLDPAEAHVVGATVDAVDHRVGFAGQLVVQPGSDEAPDDR